MREGGLHLLGEKKKKKKKIGDISIFKSERRTDSPPPTPPTHHLTPLQRSSSGPLVVSLLSFVFMLMRRVSFPSTWTSISSCHYAHI